MVSSNDLKFSISPCFGLYISVNFSKFPDSFLSLMSNDKLKIYGNDIAEFYQPCNNCHPEIYVLKAAKILKELFNERFIFIKGNCLIEIPMFVNDNTDIQIDIVHIDGDKNTYKQDFLNIMPILSDEAIIIFDDSNINIVQDTVNDLIKNEYLYRMPEFPKMNDNIKYTNEILLFKRNKHIFENIYKNKIWNNGDSKIPLSGPVSSIENTIECSQLLNNLIYNNNCKSVLDLGCGDLNWISKTIFFNDSSIKYTGIDVVESLITLHLKTYPEKLFLCKDITTYNLIIYSDIIIIRDVIFHLKNKEILSIFDNIKNKFKYLLITSCKNHINTDNFDKWHFSEKNINIEPFNKSYNFQIELYETFFNRNVYIYEHNNFYN